MFGGATPLNLSTVAARTLAPPILVLEPRPPPLAPMIPLPPLHMPSPPPRSLAPKAPAVVPAPPEKPARKASTAKRKRGSDAKPRGTPTPGVNALPGAAVAAVVAPAPTAAATAATAAAVLQDDGDDDNNDDDGPDDGVGGKSAKRAPRLHAYLTDRNKRQTCFSKRKANLLKKAHELAVLTGSEVMLVVASEIGNVYRYATDRLKPLLYSADAQSQLEAMLSADVLDEENSEKASAELASDEGDQEDVDAHEMLALLQRDLPASRLPIPSPMFIIPGTAPQPSLSN